MTQLARIGTDPGKGLDLVYVSDELPGISRQRRGKGFVYRNPDGSKVDVQQLSRIRSLAIPPAYRQVWICPIAEGHLQATGRDARGRKQYRYHPQWRQTRDAEKFGRMLAFGHALPRIRARVDADLAQPVARRVVRDSVLATIVRLLDTTLLRVGNVEYARDNGSFGLTTLRSRHAAVQGDRLTLRFRGKSGVMQEVAHADPRVARVVRRCQDLPGQELFQYVDTDGALHSVRSDDVNAYLREASGENFSAKDFRTWHGSVAALAIAGDASVPTRSARQVLGEVARLLGNTVAVCRKAYVHPRVLEILEGHDRLERDSLGRRARRRGLSADECRLLALLRQTASPPARRTSSRE